MSEPPLPREVSRVFEAFPPPVRRRLLDVRKLIFATAKAHDDVGPLTEALKWGEPAYLTVETGSGSTIRLGRVTEWVDLEDGNQAPVGQKMLLVDDEEFPILELRELVITHAPETTA